MPFGEGPRKVLDCALDISKELGFKTVNMDGYIGYAEYGHGDDYVAVLGHLDVVPKETDGNIHLTPPKYMKEKYTEGELWMTRDL